MSVFDDLEEEDRNLALDIVKRKTELCLREIGHYCIEGLRPLSMVSRDSWIDRALAAKLMHQVPAEYFSTDWLRAIAKEPRGRDPREDDLDDLPSVYIFVSLRDEIILKVGSTRLPRDRIANKHLRYGQDDSTLRGYLSYRGWPQVIVDDEIVLLVLPMAGYMREELLAVERGLDELLDPLISDWARRRRAARC